MSRVLRRFLLGTGLLLVVAAVGIWLWHLQQLRDAPRRSALLVLDRLNASLQTNVSTGLLASVALPVTMIRRTSAEQNDFLRKALMDELSADGLRCLEKEGQFGSLRSLFPDQAETWAQQAGVSADQCVAFRAVRDTLTAEVVIVTNPPPGRIVRVNNVKQLAEQ